jgi:hypothetical protein
MIGIHLCRGSIQDVALFTKAKRCANEKKLPPCHKHESKPCCEDESVVHEGTDIKADLSKIELSAVPFLYVDPPLVLLAEVIPSSSFTRTRYYNYDPPARWTDITIEHQVFLI